MKPLTDTQVWGEEVEVRYVTCPLLMDDGRCPVDCTECYKFEQQNYPQITQMDADENQCNQ